MGGNVGGSRRRSSFDLVRGISKKALYTLAASAAKTTRNPKLPLEIKL